MIAAGKPIEFEPCGQKAHKFHPGNAYSSLDTPLGPQEHQDLLNALKGFTLSENSTPQKKPFWVLKESKLKEIEEELYVCDKVAYWTQGNLLKSYAMESNIIQATWCYFYKNSLKPRLTNETECPLKPDDPKIYSLCILESNILHVYTEDGQNFSNPLPFVISNIWASDYGLLLQRTVPDLEQKKHKDLSVFMPLTFSLLHPLDEMAPVLKRTISKKEFFYDHDDEIVGTINIKKECLAVIYNTRDKFHFILKLRFTTLEEGKLCAGKVPEPGKPPTFSKSTSPNSNANVNSDLKKPQKGDSAALISGSTISKTMSPSSFGPASMIEPHPGLHEYVGPLSPDICGELVWTESKGSMGEKASKVFFCNDMIGQILFISMFKKLKQLRLIKIDEHENGSHLTFGQTTFIAASDVEYLSSLKMLLVLECNQSIALYSGTVKVCKVHIPSSMTSFDDYGYGEDPFLQTNDNFTMDLSEPQTVPPSPLPTKPIPEYSSACGDAPFVSSIIGLHAYNSSNVILETMSGTYHKVPIPPIQNSILVKRCLSALLSTLPKDICLQFHIHWYCVRNAPGAKDITSFTELQALLQTLQTQIGYLEVSGHTSSSPKPNKRARTCSKATDEAWEYLLRSEHHGLNKLGPGPLSKYHINTDSLLFPFIFLVLFALHLVYEDTKLNILLWEQLPELGKLLQRIASDLRLENYQDHYWRDFPDLCGINVHSYLPSEGQDKIIMPPYFTKNPPNVFHWSLSCMVSTPGEPLPYIPGVNTSLRNLALLYKTMTGIKNTSLITLTSSGLLPSEEHPIQTRGECLVNQLILQMVKLGIKNEDLDSMPIGASFFLRDAILQARKNPPSDWPVDAYILIGRQDLYIKSTGKLTCYDDYIPDILESDMVTKLIFNKDLRLYEVHRMLQSSKPIKINIQQRNEVTDHEFLEEQEKHLYSLSIRTMSLPVGRGMFGLRTCKPIITEALPIPKLCLSGRGSPKNVTIELTHIDLPPNLNTWPLFHNGVASGLRVSSVASDIDATWIVYNKPKGNNVDTPTEHAGFLLGLGLNGHLKKLTSVDIHDYLCKVHELTSVGILLGVSASRRGTLDSEAIKMLSIHVEALLPPTSTELDVPPVVQVAALMGVGLLYMGSGNRHMAELMLGEISRPPGPEMEHCIDRESYALTAGLAMGFITLGQGNDMIGRLDQSLADQLYRCMEGGHKPSIGLNKEKTRCPSYQIKEGETVNVDVTGPGAALALGLMFFDTNNSDIAGWMEAPDTQYLLDEFRPDLLLLKSLSRGLVMWKSVLPKEEWIKSHIPPIVSKYAFKKGQIEGQVDFQTMSQAYCNIIAGSCLCLGLKFAGSSNEDAFDTLMSYAKIFLSLSGKSHAEQAGRITIDTCLNVIVLALSLVMAGTGDLEVLRICRHLRSRLSPPNNCGLYGFHMATHMALGFLFLGGGRFTLSSKPEAIAALVCALFPKFPTHTNDNRYHLQAFRHLYVLAVEPRLLIPRNIDTKKPVSVKLKITFKPTEYYGNISYTVQAPCLIPELHLLQSIQVVDIEYWKVEFDSSKNWNKLESILKNSGELYLKPKAGVVPYTDNTRYILAYNFLQKRNQLLNLKPNDLALYLNDPMIQNISSLFLRNTAHTTQEEIWRQQMALLLAECGAQEKVELLPTCMFLLQLERHLSSRTLDLWQMKLVLAFQLWQQQSKLLPESPILNPHFTLSLKTKLDKMVLEPLIGKSQLLCNYLMGLSPADPQIASFVILHDIPAKLQVNLTKGTCLAAAYVKVCQAELSMRSLVALLQAINS